MFSKHSDDPVSFPSTWKTTQSLSSGGTQTDEVKSQDGGCQVVDQAEAGVQTEEEEAKPQATAEYDPDSLTEFLNRIAPKVIQELERQNRSQAFTRYAPRGDEEEGAGVKLLHTLRCKQIDPELVVTGLDWSSTGAVIGVTYGSNQHEDWCDHTGGIAIWNINRSDFDANQPERVIESSSCVLCLAFHPTNPALFAAGTFSGEVLLYDLSRTDEVTPLATGDCGGGGVTTVTWTTGLAGAATSLVVTTSTGHVLVWSLSQAKMQLSLKSGYLVKGEGGRVRGVLSESAGLGITAASFNTEDSLIFLLGGQGGGLFICNSASQTPTGVEHGGVSLKSCVSSSLAPHSGKVVAAQFSPHLRNAVMSAATDDHIRLYTLLQSNKAVITLHSQEGVTCARWSPSRPLVLAAGRVTGHVALCDLSSKSADPVVTLPPPEKPAAVSFLEFNRKNVRMVSVGDQLGRVHIWQLPLAAVSPLPNEQALLASLINVTGDKMPPVV